MTGPAAAQAATPGQAAHAEHQRRFDGLMAEDWQDLADSERADWEGVAQVAIDAHGVPSLIIKFDGKLTPELVEEIRGKLGAAPAAPGTGLYLAAIARLSAALREVCEETGTSTMAHHIARKALDDVDQPQRLPDLRRQLDQARAELAGLRWWVCDGPLPGGRKILGPFSSQELALEVRSYVEQVTGPGKLWVDDEDPEAASASPDADAQDRQP